MKLTKTILLALALGGLLACVSVRAQDSTNAAAGAASTNAVPHHPMMRGPSIDRLAQMLNLTADQKAKVQPIMDDNREKMRQLFMDVHNGTVAREDARAKAKEIHDATAAQMKTVLTAEQFQKWQSMSQMRRPPMQTPPAATNNAAGSAP
jgi:Spy/CpxP family protein refolding chaperone